MLRREFRYGLQRSLESVIIHYPLFRISRREDFLVSLSDENLDNRRLLSIDYFVLSYIMYCSLINISAKLGV